MPFENWGSLGNKTALWSLVSLLGRTTREGGSQLLYWDTSKWHGILDTNLYYRSPLNFFKVKESTLMNENAMEIS